MRDGVPENPRFAIVLVGDELTSGRRHDSNGAWLAEQLYARGVELTGMHTVGDGLDDIERAVRSAAGHADVVVVGGGLGPTPDDRTREGLARAAGVPLVHDDGAWQHVVDNLAKRGREPTAASERQRLMPEGGTWIPNPVGVAPGIEVGVRGALVLALPGVPREWRAMCQSHALSWLAAGEAAVTTTVWLAGVPEGEMMARIEDLPELEAIEFASYPHDGEIELRFRATGDDKQARADAACAAVRARLGEACYDPPPGGRLEHVVVAALKAEGLRVATAESITGGLIARQITAVPGASAVFPAGWVVYETRQKTEQLGVDAALIEAEGVVSEAVARAMAEAALVRAEADVALATTGTAGPDPLEQPGHEPVPPGRVYVALAVRERATRVLTLDLVFARTLVQRHATIRALDVLRRALAEGAHAPDGR